MSPDNSSSQSFPQVGSHILISQLRNYLQEKLPDYMIPAAFVVLAELPLTPNGKIDRQALPMLDGIRPELDTVFVPPQTTIETDLSAVWCEILGINKVGRHDS